MARLALVISLFASLTISQALAEKAFYSGNELLRHCESNGGGATLCLGYVGGVYDGLRVRNEKCAVDTTDVTLGQARDVVIDYVKKNPAIRHLSASILIKNAISGAFKCHF